MIRKFAAALVALVIAVGAVFADCKALGIDLPASVARADSYFDLLSAVDIIPTQEATAAQLGHIVLGKTASDGAVTRSILARIADTAPVISSTVSPRTRSAIKSPPICEGVASPDIMASKAEAASSRDSVAPVATFPIIDFRSSIAYFQNRDLMVRRRFCAVSNHEDVTSFETRPRGRSSG